MEQKLLEALRVQYIARAAKAEANLLNYFKNPAGIGEHPDVVKEMCDLVDEIASARDGLNVISSLAQPSDTKTESDK